MTAANYKITFLRVRSAERIFFSEFSRTAANYNILFLRVRSAERNFFPNFQGQQRMTKFCFWGFVLPNGFFRTDLYFKLRIKHCSVHVCVSEDCFELLVWIFWTSFLKFSKMFKLQTAESLTTTSRMANFKNTEGEKKSNDDDTFYISRDKCLRHSCAYFFGGTALHHLAEAAKGS